MHKLTVVYFLALIISTLAATAPWPPPGMDECEKQTNPSPDDMQLFKKHKEPTTEEGACFTGCMYQKMKILSSDNTFSREVGDSIIESMRKSPGPKEHPELIDKIEKIFHTCMDEANEHAPENNDSKGYCTAAKNFGKCSTVQRKILEL